MDQLGDLLSHDHVGQQIAVGGKNVGLLRRRLGALGLQPGQFLPGRGFNLFIAGKLLLYGLPHKDPPGLHLTRTVQMDRPYSNSLRGSDTAISLHGSTFLSSSSFSAIKASISSFVAVCAILQKAGSQTRFITWNSNLVCAS